MIVISESRRFTLHAAKEENSPFLTGTNLGAGATLGGTDTLAGGPRANAVNGTTYDYWLPDVPGTGAANLFFDFGTATALSFVGIAAHNIGTLGGSVRLEWSENATDWTTLLSTTPDDDSPIGFRFDLIPHRYWRIRVFDLSEGDPVAIGVAFLGLDIVMPRTVYQGFRPVITPTNVDLQSDVTVGGNLVGSQVVKRGSSLQFSPEYIPAEFIRSATWRAFQASFNDGHPTFFAWRPEKYPQDLHYIWRDGQTIQPDNTGPRDFMSFSLSARVYDG